MKMNKKGITILEVLISMMMISVVILLLIKVMFSLDKINNDDTYASSDEIARAEIIKNIESDFLKLKLNGISINKGEKGIITFEYETEQKTLVIEKDKISYGKDTYSLKSKKATYDLCPEYQYQEIDENYYLISITIPVLIEGKSNTKKDDLVLTYLGLKKENNHYLTSYSCS